ncbi:MAG TPA: caspase family protein, partial [Blastocatellia bacterium]
MEKNSTIEIIASLLLLVSAIAFVPVPARGQSQPQRARDVEIVGATREEIESGSSNQINLWAVVIGISTYKYGDQDLNGYKIKNLKNAGDDAQAVYDFLKTPEGGAFRDESEGGHLILLKDAQATKANVERELAKLKQAKPNDFFVIFIAAHGVLLPDSDPEANTSSLNPYFVLYDTDVRPP